MYYLVEYYNKVIKTTEHKSENKDDLMDKLKAKFQKMFVNPEEGSNDIDLQDCLKVRSNDSTRQFVINYLRGGNLITKGIKVLENGCFCMDDFDDDDDGNMYSNLEMDLEEGRLFYKMHGVEVCWQILEV